MMATKPLGWFQATRAWHLWDGQVNRYSWCRRSSVAKLPGGELTEVAEYRIGRFQDQLQSESVCAECLRKPKMIELVEGKMIELTKDLIAVQSNQPEGGSRV